MLGIVWFSEKKYEINISRNKRNYPNYWKLQMKQSVGWDKVWMNLESVFFSPFLVVPISWSNMARIWSDADILRYLHPFLKIRKIYK